MPVDTLHNYPGMGFRHMTQSEWQSLPDPCKGSWLEGGTDGRALHRVRVALFNRAHLLPVYIVDAATIAPRPRHALRPAGPNAAA